MLVSQGAYASLVRYTENGIDYEVWIENDDFEELWAEEDDD